jgi:hypothetical protein
MWARFAFLRVGSGIRPLTRFIVLFCVAVIIIISSVSNAPAAFVSGPHSTHTELMTEPKNIGARGVHNPCQNPILSDANRNVAVIVPRLSLLMIDAWVSFTP